MRYTSFLILLLCLLSCGPKYTLSDLPTERLHFGSKGGYTGELREYILLLNNGRLLFKDPLTDQMIKVARLDRKAIAHIQQQLDALPFDNSDTQPGNMNTVMAWHGAEEIKRLQWSSPNGAPSPQTQAFYEELMQTVRALRSSKP